MTAGAWLWWHRPMPWLNWRNWRKTLLRCAKMARKRRCRLHPQTLNNIRKIAGRLGPSRLPLPPCASGIWYAGGRRRVLSVRRYRAFGGDAFHLSHFLETDHVPLLLSGLGRYQPHHVRLPTRKTSTATEAVERIARDAELARLMRLILPSKSAAYSPHKRFSPISRPLSASC